MFVFLKSCLYPCNFLLRSTSIFLKVCLTVLQDGTLKRDLCFVFVFCILYFLQQSIFIFLSLLDCPGWQRGGGSAVAVSNDTTLLNDETFQNNYSNSLVIMQKAQTFRPEDCLV